MGSGPYLLEDCPSSVGNSRENHEESVKKRVPGQGAPQRLPSWLESDPLDGWDQVELLRFIAPASQATTDPGSIGDFVNEALRRAAQTFLEHDTDRTPESRDAEDLHDARVALRRIRSYLRTFRSVVEPSWAGAARADLGWFGGLLGEVRNLDVLADRVGDRGSHLNVDQVALEELLGAVTYVRNEAEFRLAEARVVPRYETVLATIDSLAAGKTPLSDSSSAIAELALGRLLQRPWRKVKQAARAVHHSGGEANLHQLRIRAKELRYAAEISKDIFGKPAKRLARAAQRLQDSLGDHRDALAAAAFMSRAALDRPACAFLAGQLAVLERAEAAERLEELEDDLARLRRRWRELGEILPG
jgi:CHAD domain-containing protein